MVKVKEEEKEVHEGKNIRRLVRGKYTLIITEKPQAAAKIASALGKAEEKTIGKVKYYKIKKNGKNIVVACAVGHLFNLDSKDRSWPNFNLEWIPAYKKNKWVRPYYNTLQRLAKYASEYIVATDFDVEGEVIGWNIVRFMAGEKDAKRMKYSTLTKEDIEKSYKNLRKNIEWGQAIAGETRHNLDWLYGVNLSHELIEAIKGAGRFKIISIGRVQGPALNFIVEKEKDIKKFKPKPYWQIFVNLKGHELWLKYNKNIKKEEKLKEFKNLKGEKGIAETKKKNKSVPPPVPFDLSTLQREAYRLHKISPSNTLKNAQSLYLAGLISYPRTSSQKIPESIKPKEILKKLKKNFKEVAYVTRKKPVEGKKNDPAHPSIYPVGEYKNVKGDKKKILDMVVKRFISCFSPNAKIEDKKITFTLDKNNAKFKAKGLEIQEKGWTAIYPSKFKQEEIEDIEGKKEIQKSKIEKKMTKPPNRYTPASIITKLEKMGLGTKATRSNIVDTLFKRGYIDGRPVKATPLGIKLIDTLKENSSIIIDEELTKEFEEDMEKIKAKKKGLNKLEDKTIKKAEKTIKKIVDHIEEKKDKIGKDLVNATNENYQQKKKENTIGKCPKCKGNLRIIFNRKVKRYFIGCTGYPKCRNTYTLPPGMIKPAKDKENKNQKCKECGWPILMRLLSGKKPWFFCFNPKCEKNKEKDWAKKKNGEKGEKNKEVGKKEKSEKEKRKGGKKKESKEDKKVKCPDCGKEFKSEKGLKIHIGQKH